MQAYSQDLRERVLRALDRGDRPTEIARRFEVSRIWVYQVRGREQATGVRTSLPMGGHRRSRLVEMEPVLRAWIAAEPGLPWPSCRSGWHRKALRSRSAPCGTS